MPAVNQKINMNQNNMDQISIEFNRCANYVGEIISETKSLKNILAVNYKGRASAGLNDYFTVLDEHLDVLKLCYDQLADYTTMVKEVFLSVDNALEIFYNNGGAIK